MIVNNLEGRKIWIDILKGLLILFVIIGHTTQNKLVTNFLSSFYMPCFFIVSGFLMKKTMVIRKFIIKKVKGLLLPYFFFALIWVLFCFLKSFVVESDFNIFRALLSILLPYSGSLGGNAYNLWFLPCLFFAQILVALIIYGKLILKIVAGIVWCTFLILGICISPYCSLLYATAVASIFVGIGFYISNYILSKLKKGRFPMWAMAVGAAMNVGSLLLNECLFKTVLEFSAASFGVLPIYILGAIGGSIFFISITSRLKSVKPLEYIGKNSLIYYALHYEVLAVVGYIIETFLSGDLLITISSFILTLLFTTVLVWGYNKLNIGKFFR